MCAPKGGSMEAFGEILHAMFGMSDLSGETMYKHVSVCRGGGQGGMVKEQMQTIIMQRVAYGDEDRNNRAQQPVTIPGMSQTTTQLVIFQCMPTSG
ncbi:hypothetical protein PBY51_023305 [Eleginops maclovinus]|uniref:Uncharacterized protein n=1 Tax=Eleginops maclovinus TaxID=56733 RepID=A0AAN7WTZ6_ELEMC|nr:hypothetical protein PBY51_023305 [Eleginops maclovinus]